MKGREGKINTKTRIFLPSFVPINQVNFVNKEIPASIDSLYKFSKKKGETNFYNCTFSAFPLLRKYNFPIDAAIIFSNCKLPDTLILEKYI
jgi:hypothetical protein